MNKLVTLFAFTCVFPFLSAIAAPKITTCVSKDSMVKVELTAQEGDSGMVDLKVSSNQSGRPAESTFPTREIQTENEVNYTLLDTDFSLLLVDLATGEGKLSNGQFLSPNPFIEVVCE